MQSQVYGRPRDAVRSLVVFAVLSAMVLLTGCGAANHATVTEEPPTRRQQPKTAEVVPPAAQPVRVTAVTEPAPSDLPSDPLSDFYVDSRTIQIRSPRTLSAEQLSETHVDVSEDSGRTWMTIGAFSPQDRTVAFEADHDGDLRVRFASADETIAVSDRVYHIDTTAPQAFLAVEPEREIYSPGETVRLTWTAQDANLIDKPVQVRASEGGDNWYVLTTDQPAEGQFEFTIPNCADGGAIRLRLEALDRAGNMAHTEIATIQIAGAVETTARVADDFVDSAVTDDATTTPANAENEMSPASDASEPSHGDDASEGDDSASGDEPAANEPAKPAPREGVIAMRTVDFHAASADNHVAVYDARQMMRDSGIRTPVFDAMGLENNRESSPARSTRAAAEPTEIDVLPMSRMTGISSTSLSGQPAIERIGMARLASAPEDSILNSPAAMNLLASQGVNPAVGKPGRIEGMVATIRTQFLRVMPKPNVQNLRHHGELAGKTASPDDD